MAHGCGTTEIVQIDVCAVRISHKPPHMYVTCYSQRPNFCSLNVLPGRSDRLSRYGRVTIAARAVLVLEALLKKVLDLMAISARAHLDTKHLCVESRPSPFFRVAPSCWMDACAVTTYHTSVQ